MSPDSSQHVHRVTRYYVRNTEKFIRFGENDAYPAIHIALWPAGTETVEAALTVAHDLVADAIVDHPGPVSRVVDLGCGMGAALLHLAERLDAEVALEGLTLGTPPPQLTAHMESGRVRIQQADFHRADSVIDGCSVAFSIEAMAHSDDLEAFFRSASRLIEPGGDLVVLDDFAASETDASRWLRVYRAHWLVPGVRPFSEVQRLAARHGFTLVNNRDLTPWIRLGRPRDRLLRWTRPVWGWLCRWSDYAKSLSGGDARQRCLEAGETHFRFVQFRRLDGAGNGSS